MPTSISMFSSSSSSSSIMGEVPGRGGGRALSPSLGGRHGSHGRGGGASASSGGSDSSPGGGGGGGEGSEVLGRAEVEGVPSTAPSPAAAVTATPEAAEAAAIRLGS